MQQQLAQKPDEEGGAPSVKAASEANPPASVGFAELNEKLEAQFGKNVKQLQDSLTQVSNDLKANKQAMAKVESELKALEKSAKEQVKEISDRVEVERCVQEMVSWVSEQITNQQVVENLNKVARKVNQIGEKVYSVTGGSDKAPS